MERTHYAYIAKEPCGCITGAAVDEPQYAKDVAKDVADWIKEGRSVERVSLSAQARCHFMRREG